LEKKKKEDKKAVFKGIRSIDDIYSRVREEIVGSEIDKTVKAVEYFKVNEVIGERELRKILG
jgi:primase-polymerase (primpol)-like protein